MTRRVLALATYALVALGIPSAHADLITVHGTATNTLTSSYFDLIGFQTDPPGSVQFTYTYRFSNAEFSEGPGAFTVVRRSADRTILLG